MSPIPGSSPVKMSGASHFASQTRDILGCSRVHAYFKICAVSLACTWSRYVAVGARPVAAHPRAVPPIAEAPRDPAEALRDAERGRRREYRGVSIRGFMAISAQVPPTHRRVTAGQSQEARDDGGAPLRSHDREGVGDLGAAEIASGCVCACPEWCAAGAA